MPMTHRLTYFSLHRVIAEDGALLGLSDAEIDSLARAAWKAVLLQNQEFDRIINGLAPGSVA